MSAEAAATANPPEPPLQQATPIPTGVKDLTLVESRRQQIVGAAIQLFAHQGYHLTTVRDIARAAGVSVGSVYTYFPSKDRLLEFAGERVMEDFFRRFAFLDREANPASVVERFRYAFRVFLEMVDQTADLHLIIYRESSALDGQARRRLTDFELAIRRLFSDLLDEGIASGTFRPHDSALRAQTTVFVGHMWALKRWWLHAHMTLDAYVEEQLSLLLDDVFVGSPRAS